MAAGAKELNLVAEDTNQYYLDRRGSGKNLAVLMRELSKIEGLCVLVPVRRSMLALAVSLTRPLAHCVLSLARHWIRILYAYPSYFSDDLIDEIATNPKVAKYIDMPLQHISNLTLLAMNRPPKDHTMELLKKLRDRIPGLALRTTFISGFPSEREEDHRELVEFVKTFKFERTYSYRCCDNDRRTRAHAHAHAHAPAHAPAHARAGARAHTLCSFARHGRVCLLGGGGHAGGRVRGAAGPRAARV